jgi:hypothetical protein
MAKEKLTQLCVEHQIPCKEITREKMEFYGTQKYDEDVLIDYLIELDQILKGNIISIGGFSAGSKTLGFRPMRRISNDLDCITNPEGIRLLNNHFNGQLYQTQNYGDVFLEYNQVPVGFDVGETHGWPIPEDFFQDVKRFSFSKGGFNSISPEYLIGLKARRSITKKRFYGKDALDTINIILAPFYKEELKEVDYDKLGKIIKEHASQTEREVQDYLKFIEGYVPKVKKREIPLLQGSLNHLKKSVKKVYSF